MQQYHKYRDLSEKKRKLMEETLYLSRKIIYRNKKKEDVEDSKPEVIETSTKEVKELDSIYIMIIQKKETASRKEEEDAGI